MAPALAVSVRIAFGIDRAIVVAATVATVVSLAILFVTLMTEVILRYFTARSLGWPNEMPALLYPWLAMGGAVLAAQRGRHIAVTLLQEFLPVAVTRMLLIFLHLMAAAGFLYLAWIGLTVLQVAGGERYPVSRISAYWAYLALVAGFTLIAVTSITSVPRVLIEANPVQARNEGPEVQ